MTSSRGLELGDMETVTDHEVSAFAGFYNNVLGHRHIGLDLWLETRPDVLKRYRQYSDTATPRTFEDDHRITGAGFTTFYAVVGYDVGVRYAVHMMQVAGLTRAQVYESLAICFLVAGPLRALRADRQLVVNIAGSASLNGGMAGLSVLSRAASDVLKNWDRR